MQKELDSRLLIGIIGIVVLLLLGIGWKFVFRSGPSLDAKDITMPVLGQVQPLHGQRILL